MTREDAASYLVARGPVEATLREKGSRFLARVRPVGDEEAARNAMEAIAAELPDATHHCWAWRIGWPPRERSQDAGEPAGTAGAPILRALRGADVTDTLVVVARWFGGTKLGRGGLIRAYGAAARAALEAAGTRRHLFRETVRLTLPYEHTGAVERLVDPPAVEVVGERYGAEVELVLAVVPSRRAALEELAASRGLRLESLETERGPE